MSHDVVIIGAGSAGLPLAYYLGSLHTDVLVIEKNPSPGQGENKAAIGGVRASHSEPVKILAAKRSIEILKEMEKEHDIEFKKGGYLFLARDETTLGALKRTGDILQRFGVFSSILKPEDLGQVVSGINRSLYKGGLFSPDDINVSPLKTAYRFYLKARDRGVRFQFDEQVTGFESRGNRVLSVKTKKREYSAASFVLANGAGVAETGRMLGIEVPVHPDSHEAGISALYRQAIGPMIVDTSPDGDRVSRTFYFTQNGAGALIFCYTPYSSLYGTHTTSQFGTAIARRIIETIPALGNVYVRRTWRGYYPNTPDGVPIADRAGAYENLYILGGMCGQGVMLGPGLAESFARFVVFSSPLLPDEYWKTLSFNRAYDSEELLR
jgi:sarcosine oxidase subunit beta